MFWTPSIDLFASRINHQLHTYVSWYPDPCAIYINALTLDWGTLFNRFVSLPFCVITRCLKKIVQDRATVTIVVPLWLTQAWFDRLLSLLIINASKSFQSVEKCVNPSIVRNNAPVESETDLDGMQSIRNTLLTTRFLQTLPTSSPVVGTR